MTHHFDNVKGSVDHQVLFADDAYFSNISIYICLYLFILMDNNIHIHSATDVLLYRLE